MNYLNLNYFRHMKEHNHEKYVNVEQLSENQVLAQYFRNFDLDKNGVVDGLEILKSIHKQSGQLSNVNTFYEKCLNFQSLLEEHAHDEQGPDTEPLDILDLVDMVDEEVQFYDTNKDGLITYLEFITNHKKKIASGDTSGLMHL